MDKNERQANWHHAKRALVGVIAAGILSGVFGQAAPVTAAPLPITSTEDVTPPEASNLVIEPLAVDVTAGDNKTFTATITATDDLSGVQSLQAQYRLANTSSWQSIWFGFHLTAGDPKNGTYEATATVTPQQHNGPTSSAAFGCRTRSGTTATTTRQRTPVPHPSPSRATPTSCPPK